MNNNFKAERSSSVPPNKSLENKSLSLPRIKNAATDRPKKPLQEMHKVRWSMAPRCLLAGHEGKEILYICINPGCQQETRLLCEECFFRQHKVHNQELLAVDEVKRGEIEKLRYWPFDQKYRRVFEFVSQQESYISNMVQDINATFNSMAMRVLASIDKMRLELLKQIDNYYLKKTEKKTFTERIKKELDQCFQLKKIGEIVRQLFSKEIRHEVFAEQMNRLLNEEEVLRSRESLLRHFEGAEKGSDMFFDKLHFLKKENWIIEQIDGQRKALKEQAVTLDEAEMGIEKIVVQTIDYLNKNAKGMQPLTFEDKQLEDGSHYTGFIHQGNRTLFGMRSYKNGFVYYGEWKNNARNGWGVYQNRATGYRYAGEWKEDRKWGFGRETSLTTAYEGNFQADKKEGFGVLMEEGARWEVRWKNDKKHGAGKVIEKGGEEREVYFLNGVESMSRGAKASPAFDIKELSKKFGSVKSTSV